MTASRAPDKTAIEYYKEGISHYNKQQYQEAHDCFAKAKELESSKAAYWGYHGDTLRLLNQEDDALKSFEKALELAPRYAAAWNSKGLILKAQKNLREAAKYFAKAKDLASYQATYWFNHGDTLRLLGHDSEALLSLEKALDLNPSYTAARNSKQKILKKQMLDLQAPAALKGINSNLKMSIANPQEAQGNKKRKRNSTNLPHNSPLNPNPSPLESSTTILQQLVKTEDAGIRDNLSNLSKAPKKADSLLSDIPELDTKFPDRDFTTPPKLPREERNKIGRSGENIVFNILKNRYQQKYKSPVGTVDNSSGFTIHDANTKSSVQVTWYNKGLPHNEDKMKPHDILITKTKEGICYEKYIEVKATQKYETADVKLSSSEVTEMFKYNHRYTIFRVYGVNANEHDLLLDQSRSTPKQDHQPELAKPTYIRTQTGLFYRNKTRMHKFEKMDENKLEEFDKLAASIGASHGEPKPLSEEQLDAIRSITGYEEIPSATYKNPARIIFGNSPPSLQITKLKMKL